eukprot:747153-Hanusia_phi.AAC.2
MSRVTGSIRYKQEKANALKMLIPGPGNARPSSSLGYTSTYSSHYVEKKPLHDLAGSKMVGEEDVEYEAGSNVPKARIDYLFNQLRQICCKMLLAFSASAPSFPP